MSNNVKAKGPIPSLFDDSDLVFSDQPSKVDVELVHALYRIHICKCLKIAIYIAWQVEVVRSPTMDPRDATCAIACVCA